MGTCGTAVLKTAEGYGLIMDRTELVRLASRIKARSRDPEVLALCDATMSTGQVLTHANRPKADRRAYMRDLMRKRRAAERALREGKGS